MVGLIFLSCHVSNQNMRCGSIVIVVFLLSFIVLIDYIIAIAHNLNL